MYVHKSTTRCTLQLSPNFFMKLGLGKKEEKKIIENQRKDNRFHFTMFFESPNMWREMNRDRGVEKKRITVESAAGDEDCCAEVGTGV